MTPTEHRRVLWALAALAVLIALFVFFVGWLGHRSIQDELALTRHALESVPFECPDGATPQVQRSGQIGWARYCMKAGLRHGPWQGWEEQRMIAEGAYVDGEEDGLWVWYLPDGEVHRTIEYRGGEEISDQIRAVGEASD